MKLRLSILLLAAALAAAPAAGQTIKSLGFNTTNGQVVYSGSNSLTFTNALQFSTNARAATRTNLGLGWSALTNTNAATSLLGFTANGQVVANTGTNVLTFTNEFVKFNTIVAYTGDLGVKADNVLFDANIEFTGTNANQNIATTRTNLGLGATNNVTFSNIAASGTLTATGDTVLSGVNNTMPNATNAASASSLMTRDLSDDRYTTSIWLTQFSDNQTITNGGVQLLAPGRFNSWSVGYGASVPSGFTEFRVVLGFGWLQNPATNSTNFPVFVRFDNRGASSSTTTEAEHGTAFSRTDLYPTNAGSTGLAGTLTRRAVFSTTNTVYSFISDWVTIPNTWQSNASSNGFYHTLGVAIANNTGGSLTDGFSANHPAVGLIEFRK